MFFSFSLPELQAVKMILFAPCDTKTIEQTINKNINDLPEKFSGLKTCLNI